MDEHSAFPKRKKSVGDRLFEYGRVYQKNKQMLAEEV